MYRVSLLSNDEWIFCLLSLSSCPPLSLILAILISIIRVKRYVSTVENTSWTNWYGWSKIWQISDFSICMVLRCDIFSGNHHVTLLKQYYHNSECGCITVYRPLLLIYISEHCSWKKIYIVKGGSFHIWQLGHNVIRLTSPNFNSGQHNLVFVGI